MSKDNYIKFRCSDDFKNLIEKQAKEHGRSISSYMEYLVRKDVDTMRVVYNEYVTDEMAKVFKGEKSIYLSTDGHQWLFTDMNVFNEMDKKFKFDIETEERDHVFNTNMEDYLTFRYEEDVIEYFGLNIEVSDYNECVLDMIENNKSDLCCNEWEEVIDKWMKVFVIDEIKSRLKDIFSKMINDGWNIKELENIVSDLCNKTGLE